MIRKLILGTLAGLAYIGAAFTTNTTVTAASTPQTHTLAVAYASQTLAANGGRAIWQYVATSTTAGTWYRIQ